MSSESQASPTLTCAQGGVCVVGDTGPGGGKVFYTSHTAFDCGPTLAARCNYLEFALATTGRMFWSANFRTTSIGDSARNTAIGTGYANTNAIVSQNGTYDAVSNRYEAGFIRNYSGGGLTDWYQPAKDELNQLRIFEENAVSKDSGFWDYTLFFNSSTEYDSYRLWGTLMYSNSDMVATGVAKSHDNFAVPIRAFSAPNHTFSGSASDSQEFDTNSNSYTVQTAIDAGSGDGSLTYSTTSSTCSVDSSTGVITISGSGNCLVTVGTTGSSNYTDTATTSFTLSVTPAPAPTFSASAISIPDTNVGQTSASQTVTITNTGNANLIFGSGAVSLSGPNEVDFSIVTDTCSSQTVAPSATCTVTVTFSPAYAGTNTANLVFSDNASGSPHSVSLSALATVVPAPIWSPSGNFLSDTTVFTDTVVGETSSPQTITITNSGDADLIYGAGAVILYGGEISEFSIVSDNCSSQIVTPASTCTVTVTFSPLAGGSRFAYLHFVDNADGSPHLFALYGNGLAPTFSASAISIPDTTIGQTSATQTLTITNTGIANLIFGSGAVSLSGANSSQFSIVTDNCSSQTIAPSATCTVAFTFSPASAGTNTANLVFTDNASGSPHSVSLSALGTAAQAPILFANGISIPETPVGQTSVSQTLTMSNRGNANLVFGTGAVSLSGADASQFSIVTDNCSNQTIAPSATCTVVFTFNPTSEGLKNFSCVFQDNALGSPHTVLLTARATTPVFYASSPTIPDTTVGQTSSPQTVTITNNGNANLIFGSGAVSISGANVSDFSIFNDNCSSQTIAPSATCTVSILFSPSAEGIRSANLVFADSASSSPQPIVLVGIGVAVAPVGGGIGNSGGGSGSNILAPQKVLEKDVSVTPGVNSLRVAINYSGSTSDAPASYLVVANPGGMSCNIVGSSSNCEIPGLTAGSAYSITIIAINSVGSSEALVLSNSFSPLAEVKQKSSATISIKGFRQFSAKLTSAIKRAVSNYLSLNPSLTVFTCTGFASAKQVTKAIRTLAKARAMAICAYILKLRPTATLTTFGRTPKFNPNANYRKAVLLGTS